jgi:hypothetical protein
MILRAVVSRTTLSTGAAGVVWTPSGHRLDAEASLLALPRPWTVVIDGALEAAIAKTAKLLGVVELVAVAVDAAQGADVAICAQVWTRDADVGFAVRILNAQVHRTALAHVAARSPAVGIGLSEILLAIKAVVDTGAVPATLARPAADTATADGLIRRTALFLLLPLFLLLCGTRHLVQAQAESGQGTSSEISEGGAA